MEKDFYKKLEEKNQMINIEKISIILVNYNTKELTLQTIRSIYEMTKEIEFEIIVVDNNSHDGSIMAIKENFKNVIVIENPLNSGFGIANNIGSEVALGEYLFFLNTDTILLNNAVKILADFLDENQNIGAVGGNLYTKDLNPATSINRIFPGILSELDTFLFNIPSKIIFNKSVFFNYSDLPIVFKGNISGADLMIRKELFEKVGKFDKDFFMYYEETELLYRVCKQRYALTSLPDAKIIHLEGASEERKEISHKRSFDSKWKYFIKTNKTKWIFLIHVIFQLTAIQRIFLFKIFGNITKENYWKKLKKVESESYKERVNE